MNEAAMNTNQTMPAAKGGLVPYIVVDTQKAGEFYRKAFGAEEAFCVPRDEQGRTMHLHLYINGSSLMLCDAYPEHGHPMENPQGFTLQLIVDDIDFWWERAVKAGCEITLPLQLMFWGDRYGQLRDPFGISWAMNAPNKGA
ncbi:VOC family protein [Rhizobium sp. KVB221]|uniref:VOC family protein n=1 Tax=Rhizobium setariae TaxID=2801340 RepID=A0A936YR35_9HYPH|nr:VOC family protein [Rhizobium setariae]MBL0375163.1 VOC family protein [Rhizobium setariae]